MSRMGGLSRLDFYLSSRSVGLTASPESTPLYFFYFFIFYIFSTHMRPFQEGHGEPSGNPGGFKEAKLIWPGHAD